MITQSQPFSRLNFIKLLWLKGCGIEPHFFPLRRVLPIDDLSINVGYNHVLYRSFKVRTLNKVLN